MPNFKPYSNYGYLALKKETTVNTAVVPDNYLRLISENLTANFNNVEINEIASDRDRRQRTIEGRVEVSGEIEFYVEPKMVGHFLTSVFGDPTTQTLTAGTAFRHTFSVDDPESLTIDVQPADAPHVHRFVGCYITGLTLTQEENAVKATASVTAHKAFINARVLADVSSGTTLTMDQTAGLTTSDTIIVAQKENGFTSIAEFTIASIDSETQITTGSTIAVTIDQNDLVMIKRSTPSYDMRDPFNFNGGTQIYAGDDVDNTSQECKEDLEIEVMNEVEARYCSGLEKEDRFPSDILVKGFMANATLTKYYDNQSYIDKARANAEFGLRVLMQHDTVLEANSATQARTYWGTGNGFYVEADTAGKAGNDYNVTIVINTTDTLAASISGNNILIQLANTDASKNTGTLIAAAVNALSGVSSSAEGAGTEQFTAAVDNTNLGDTISGATAAVVGRDASEQAYLQFDFAAAVADNFEVGNNEDEIITQEIPLKFLKDTDPSDDQRKKYTVKVRLVNSVSSY